jgi:hypothetical protein
MVRAEYANTKGSPNPSGSTPNQPLELPLQQAPQSAPYFKPSGTTRNKAIAQELANRSAYQFRYAIVNVVFKF